METKTKSGRIFDIDNPRINDIFQEEYKKYPNIEGDPEMRKKFNEAFENRIKEITEKSLEEKKQGSQSYRNNMFWAGIETQEDFDKKRLEVIKDYKNGNFFLNKIGRWRNVDPELSIMVTELRRDCIKEYDLKTAFEFMILDTAMTSYFHYLRLNEAVNSIMASVEWDLFTMDAPRFTGVKNNKGDYAQVWNDETIAERLANNLTEVLQPMMERYHRMFLRSLKAIRDLKRGNIMLNIGNVGQMNIGEKQVNLSKVKDKF